MKQRAESAAKHLDPRACRKPNNVMPTRSATVLNKAHNVVTPAQASTDWTAQSAAALARHCRKMPFAMPDVHVTLKTCMGQAAARKHFSSARTVCSGESGVSSSASAWLSSCEPKICSQISQQQAMPQRSRAQNAAERGSSQYVNGSQMKRRAQMLARPIFNAAGRGWGTNPAQTTCRQRTAEALEPLSNSTM